MNKQEKKGLIQSAGFESQKALAEFLGTMEHRIGRLLAKDDVLLVGYLKSLANERHLTKVISNR